jgi:hypothetical protein
MNPKRGLTTKKSVLAPSIIALAIVLWALVPQVLAHSPLGSGSNESLATATLIPDPTKSWALYAQLHEGGEANYYGFNITVGQRIHIMLYKSRRSDEAAFSPSFVLMGPDLVEQGSVPNYLQKPPDAKLLKVQGRQAADASYEPFSPSSFYSMADLAIDAPATGTYYVAVFEPYEGGHYGLAIGDRESYGIAEWILIPLNLISIYQWEGQSLMMILSPMIATIITGLTLIIWRMYKMSERGTVLTWLGALAGLLFVGTAVTTLFEMILASIGAPIGAEIAVTLVFVLIPFLLGFATLRLSLWKGERVGIRRRMYLAVLGVVALFIWSGLLIGPTLAIVASLAPARRVGRV